MRWLLALLLVLAACGGGGDTPPAPPPPNPLYVTTFGKNTNFGDADAPLHSIRKAAQIALDGYEIIVAPGVYREEVSTDRTGTPAQALTFVADVDGTRTDSPAGPVVIDVRNLDRSGFSLSNSSDTIIDGFTVRGSNDAGIVLKSGSADVTVRNCIVHENPGDGIRVQDSARVTVFNNLVYRNGGTGVLIAGQRSGSPNARVVNNTIAYNGERGITVGTSSAASPAAYLRNNILFDNAGSSALQVRVITSPRSDLDFDGDYNLVSPPTYDPDSVEGTNDFGGDPGFVDGGADDYHLNSNSRAVDSGDNGIPGGLANILRPRSTTGAGPDGGRLDLGYHFRE